MILPLLDDIFLGPEHRNADQEVLIEPPASSPTCSGPAVRSQVVLRMLAEGMEFRLRPSHGLTATLCPGSMAPFGAGRAFSKGERC